MLRHQIRRYGPIWYGAIYAALADVDGGPLALSLKRNVWIDVTSEHLDEVEEVLPLGLGFQRVQALRQAEKTGACTRFDVQAPANRDIRLLLVPRMGCNKLSWCRTLSRTEGIRVHT